MLLQIGPLLRLGSKCYYGWDFYYAWVQMLLRMGPLLHLGPVITLVPSTCFINCSQSRFLLLRFMVYCERDFIFKEDTIYPLECKQIFSMNSLFASNFIYSFQIFALMLFLVINIEFTY